jgi:hypothetical protein
MNHHDEFCKFIRSQKWMSVEFGDQVIIRMANAMKDAYERGRDNALSCHTCDVNDPLTKQKMKPKPTLDKLSKKQINELKSWLRGDKRHNEPFPGSPVINAIKRAREMTDASLKDSKFYIDRLQEML